MTPKEKAEAMVLKFSNIINYDFIGDLKWHNPMDTERNRRVKKDAKKCALIAIDEIIEQNNIWILHIGKGTNNFWEEVKKEINNI